MQEAGKKMAKAQRKYKKDFDKRVRLSKEAIKPESLVFVRKIFYGPHGQKHKLAPVNERLLRVMSATVRIVVI